MHVNPGEKILGARIIGLPPVPIGIDEENKMVMITLPFNISYYGNTYNSLWVNNNGYVQFTTEYPDSTYQPAIPNNAGVMLITPFWNDIDTEYSGSGYVHCKITDDMGIPSTLK